VPVEFLTDVQAGAYGRFAGPLSRVELERVFFLDDGDLGLVGVSTGSLRNPVEIVSRRFVGTPSGCNVAERVTPAIEVEA